MLIYPSTKESDLIFTSGAQSLCSIPEHCLEIKRRDWMWIWRQLINWCPEQKCLQSKIHQARCKACNWVTQRPDGKDISTKFIQHKCSPPDKSSRAVVSPLICNSSNPTASNLIREGSSLTFKKSLHTTFDTKLNGERAKCKVVSASRLKAVQRRGIDMIKWNLTDSRARQGLTCLIKYCTSPFPDKTKLTKFAIWLIFNYNLPFWRRHLHSRTSSRARCASWKSDEKVEHVKRHVRNEYTFLGRWLVLVVVWCSHAVNASMHQCSQCSYCHSTMEWTSLDICTVV